MSTQTAKTRFASPGGAGGGAGLTVEQGGVPIVAGADKLNFTGAVNVTPGGPGEATVNIPGGTGVPETNFVFRPGGVTQGNVYATWAPLYAAINGLVQGPVTIYLDDHLSGGAGCVIPAGAYNFSPVTIEGITGTGVPPKLVVSNGVTWTDLRKIKNAQVVFQNTAQVENLSLSGLILENCQLDWSAATSYVWNFTGGFGGIQVISCFFTPNPAVPLANSALGMTALQIVRDQLQAFGAAFPATFWGGPGNLLFSTDGSSTFVPQTLLTGTATTTYLTLANNVGYTPATPANWAVVPTQVAEALDALATSPLPEYHTLTGGEILAKQFNLSTSPTEYWADVVHGPSLNVGTDFTIVGNVFGWAGLGLDGVLSAGDIIRVVHN